MKARSSQNPQLLYDLDDRDIAMGDHCAKGSQLRPHVAWFGESVPEFEPARHIVLSADLLLVTGTSLQVYPAASLMHAVQPIVPVFLIAPEVEFVDSHITWYRDRAVNKVPELVMQLLENGLAVSISRYKPPKRSA